MMPADPRHQVLRLRKKHAPGDHETPTVADGERLVNAQSVWHALLAGLVVVLVFAILWSMVTRLFEQFFPWLSLLLGPLAGLAIRRGGQGFDWRFPLLAGCVTFFGALLCIVIISAGTTAEEFETSTLVILRNVTTMTWPVFFDEVLTIADFIYAFFAAVTAATLCLRRLDRREFQALRLWQEDQQRRAR